MINEEKARAETEKITRMVNLALDINVKILEQARPDAEFLATVLDGWIADMMHTAVASIDAFLEYRAKLDQIVTDMGLDMLRGHKG